MAILKNFGLFSGTLGEARDVDTVTTTATTTLITGMTATKSASKETWVNGEMTYTITLINNTGTDYTDLVLTDTLDTTLIDLVANSVYINGTLATYTYSAGFLRLDLNTLPNETTMTITFNVVRI